MAVTVKDIERLQNEREELATDIQVHAALLDDEENPPEDMGDWQKAFDSLNEKFDAKTVEINDSKDALMADRDRRQKAEEAVAKIQGTERITIEDADPSAKRKMIPALAKHWGSVKNFKGSVQNRDAKERAYRFGMWALATVSRQLPGRFNFAQAVKFADDQWPTNVLTTNDGHGSHYLVPEEFGIDLIDLREQYGLVRRLFKRRGMTSDTRTDPRRAGGLTAYFVSEGAAGTESNKEWDNVRLTAKDLMVLSRYTAQLSMDSVIDIGDDLAGEISYAFTNKEDDCGLNGTGTSTYGGITGARQSLNTAAGSPTTTSAGGIVVGAGNAYSELTLANFEEVVGVLPQYADTDNTSWVVHRKVYFTVMKRLELAAGGVTAFEISEGGRQGRPMFLGYPVEVSQVMPSTAANSQVCALLGDFSLGASFGDRQQDSIMFSEHANIGGQSLFERNEIGVRGTERFDINVHDVGTASTAGPIVGLQTLNA